MTMEQKLDVTRKEIIRELYAIHTQEALNSIRRSVKRILKREEAEEETEYISKQEVLDGIRQGLTEFYRAQRTGEKQKTLQEVIDEL